MQEKFPWYTIMRELMGTSPVVDRSALQHSATDTDNSFLYALSGKSEDIVDDDAESGDEQRTLKVRWFATRT